MSGICYYGNGDRYEGEWRDDLRCGRGICHYADGAIYDGQWQADMREGHGVCVFANAERYEGQWHLNQRTGEGLCTFFDQEMTRDEVQLALHNPDLLEKVIDSSRPSAHNHMYGSASFRSDSQMTRGGATTDLATFRSSQREGWIRSPGMKKSLASMMSFSQMHLGAQMDAAPAAGGSTSRLSSPRSPLGASASSLTRSGAPAAFGMSSSGSVTPRTGRTFESAAMNQSARSPRATAYRR